MLKIEGRMVDHQRIVFLNGKLLPEAEASLPIFDRGLLFADAVYEGFGILDGQIVDFIYHMQRLEKSLEKIAVPITFTTDSMFQDMEALIEKNDVTNGFLYLHVTRGAGDRAFHYHDAYTPNIFAFTQGEKFPADGMPPAISLHTAPDLRWARRDIKSTNLLAQVMAKHAAHEAGDYEALMIDHDGYVTEAGSSSFFYIKDGDLFVRPVNNEILHGITRQTMLRVAEQMDLRFVEQIYKLNEVLEADEAFITASSIYVLPVSKIDSHMIADGQAGPFTIALRKAYLETARAEFYQVKVN